MTATVQFGHSTTERLLLRDITFEDGWYSALGDLRCGSFQGTVLTGGFKHDLQELLAQLKTISTAMKGAVNWNDLEGQLNFSCSIGVRGEVTYKVEIDEFSRKLAAEFESDLSSLDAAISNLTSILRA